MKRRRDIFFLGDIDALSMHVYLCMLHRQMVMFSLDNTSVIATLMPLLLLYGELDLKAAEKGLGPVFQN